MSRFGISLPVAVVALILISSVPVPQRASSNGIPIQHVVVIVQENHSFASYVGTYPGANGLPPGVALPAKPNGTASVKPFPLNSDVPPRDICHSWGCAHAEFDGGKMDGFVYTAASVMTMGYFDYHQIPYYRDYASQYVLSASQPISGGDLEYSLLLAVVVLGVVAALRRFGRWRW